MTTTDIQEAFDEIQQHLVSSARELFEGNSLPVEERVFSGRSPTVSGQAVVSSIGYAGDCVRGTLALVTSREFITALQPEELREMLEQSDDAVCDVIGEFANMLLGRIKNQLLGRGVVFMLALPSSAIGTELHFSSPSDALAQWHEFASSAGSIFIRFDALFEKGFVLGHEAESQGAAVTEGSMLEF